MLHTTTAALRQALRRVAPAAARKNTIPILSHILISAADGVASLRATNLDQWVDAPLDLTGLDADVSAVVSPRALRDILAVMETRVTIAAPDQAGAVRCTFGELAVTLPGLPAKDMPVPPEPKNPRRLILPADALHRLFGRVRDAISTEEMRYYLNGIYLEAAGTVLTAAATDGYRLHIAPCEAVIPEGPSVSGILPRAAVTMLMPLLRSLGSTPVSLDLEPMYARVGSFDWSVTTKLIDGTFPEFRHIYGNLPKAAWWVRIADAAAFAHAIRCVTALSTERTRPVQLRPTAEGLLLRASSEEFGVAELLLPKTVAEIDLAGQDAMPEPIGFQSRYLRQAAAAIAGQVDLGITGPATPMRWEAPEGARAILMPMRVS